ncbi:hypothetical protein TIFTF001_003088 [Ficus carica]|uniref:F-box domain-containing protein n=1 Tax=Ficus carica TaxID=3494 RepID=A0AA87ZDQ1_FICCA|nr:hypothetical protein TIFTF001_003088 [Ficus carica]
MQSQHRPLPLLLLAASPSTGPTSSTPPPLATPSSRSASHPATASSSTPSEPYLASQEPETLVNSMEIYGDDHVGLVGNKCPKCCFLTRVRRMVMSEDIGDENRNHKLIMIAVHAVFLESGFVEFDDTPPEILGDKNCTSNVKDSVLLKCQTIGRFVYVFGRLTSGGPVVYQVCLDKNKFAPAISSLSMCSKGEHKFEGEALYELWRIVKDELATPLLTDLRVKAGLSSPPCFMSLPPELQTKILEFLPGTDIAKLGRVCKELKDLSCNNDLWKKKFAEDFGMMNKRPSSEVVIRWKKEFAGTYLQTLRSKRKKAETANAN